MPIVLPIILASTHLLLVADRVPQFNIEPTCHAVAQAAPGLNRDDDGCKRDERAAHDTLEQTWSSFTQAQRDHCARLSTLGGFPSYVELLTCLEIDKFAKELATKNCRIAERGAIEKTGQTPVETEGKAGRLINQ